MNDVRGKSLRIQTSKEPVEKSIKLVQIVREHCTFLFLIHHLCCIFELLCLGSTLRRGLLSCVLHGRPSYWASSSACAKPNQKPKTEPKKTKPKPNFGFFSFQFQFWNIETIWSSVFSVKNRTPIGLTELTELEKMCTQGPTERGAELCAFFYCKAAPLYNQLAGYVLPQLARWDYSHGNSPPRNNDRQWRFHVLGWRAEWAS